MLYYDTIDITEGIDLTKRFAPISFLIMNSSFKILYAMVVMI